MAVIHVTKENFDSEVLSSGLPVLVDFWANWCGPCKMVGPVIDQLSEDFDGKAKVVKIDIDTEGELAIKFGVMSIPTVIVFKNGEVVDKAIGASPKSFYAEMLEKHL